MLAPNPRTFWSIMIALISFTAVCNADQTNKTVETVLKSDAQEIRGVEFWIDVADARELGSLIRLRIGSKIEINPEEFGVTNAEKIIIEAKSADGHSVPAKYFNRATVNSLTMVDYLIAPGDYRAISSVNVTWKNETKSFKLLPAGSALPPSLKADALTNNSMARSDPDLVVKQMLGFSMQSSGHEVFDDGTIDPKEQHRKRILKQFRVVGKGAVPALIRALEDSNVQMRQNAELVMISLAGAYDGEPKLDIRETVPALIKATEDADNDVRAWAAHALGGNWPGCQGRRSRADQAA